MEVSPNRFNTLEDFKDGTILLFDKPLGWTSFDVVNKVRGMLRHRLAVRKLKVGHAGTLDPLATGLLVICTGKMTREIQGFIDDEKGYTGSFHLGATTPSYDLETEVDQTWPTSGIAEKHVLEAAASFLPGYSQTAPMFSAKKVDGKVAYKAARKGKTLDIPPRYIEIKRFDVSKIELPKADFDVVCSKGTYIRSLVHDLGGKLNNGAHLTALRRYRSGGFDVSNAMTIEGFDALLDGLPPIETP